VILPEKLRLNLQYQRTRSLRRDLTLLWMTARYSFFPRGFDRDRILRSLGA
jgi:lipopolysaccharide/colanic/teichoic acid biosynthesis glycosyltransferase